MTTPTPTACSCSSKVRNAPGREPRFWLRRPDGKGGWFNDTRGVNTGILYHAPGVARAIAEGRVVAVVEGEEDCQQRARARHHRDLQCAWCERTRQAAKVDEGT